VQLYRDDGIVLRTQKLGEADRIITVLGRTSGRVRAVAKGVRRTKSRFGARLEPFTHVDLMLHVGRSLDVITQAEVIRPYGSPLAGDYPGTPRVWRCWKRPSGSRRWRRNPRCASCCSLSADCVPSAERSTILGWSLTLFAALARGGRIRACPAGVRPLWRVGTVAGLRRPGRRHGVRVLPSARGRLACGPDGGPDARLAPRDWENADRSERRHQVECSGLVAAYLQWHLEHSIRSLRHVERV